MHQKARLALLLAAFGIAAPAPAQQLHPRVQSRIDRILRATPLIDGHNDLPWALREDYGSRVEGLESGSEQRKPPLMTDMRRLRAGRVGGQFWSVFIEPETNGDEAIRQTVEQIDVVTRLVKAYPGDLELALTADDIERIHRRGRVASLIGIEGGHQIGGSLPALRQFYRLGARYMTLTHFKTTDWADSATDQPRHDGLSGFGEQVVREMNRLGMLVDLSHVSPDTMRDALRIARAPVIFSHSGAAAINPHPRNVPDDVLSALKSNGGVVMVYFFPNYLSPGGAEWAALRSAESARLTSLFPYSEKKVAEGVSAWEAAHPRPPVAISVVADHIEHVARVAGYDHVGIGGDLDGIPYSVAGLEGVDRYPLLFAELIRRGWTDSNLAKLAGRNLLRALRGAEAVAASSRNQPPVMATLEPAAK